MFNSQLVKNRWHIAGLGRTSVLLGCLGLIGCGSGQLPCVPVKVEVLVAGKPFGPCAVRFERKNMKPGERTTVANLDKSGVGQCSTYKLNDGIPEGDYKVAIEPFGVGSLPIERTYLNLSSSPLTAQVFNNSETIKFELEEVKRKGGASSGLPDRLGAKSNQELLELSMPSSPR